MFNLMTLVILWHNIIMNTVFFSVDIYNIDDFIQV